MRISRVRTILASAAAAALLTHGQVQAPKGGTSGPPGTSGGGTTGTSLPGRGTSPLTLPPSSPSPDTLNRGAFFYGKVVLPDGTAPPSQVVIEKVCNGNVRPQAYTNSMGDFSFQLGQTQDVLPDASESRGSSTASGSASPTTAQQVNNLSTSACELRAALAGYRSDLVSLAGRRNLDDPNLGTIFLHRLGNIEGLTTSATSLLAPKDAKKAFEKGLDATKKEKFEQARTDFQKSVELYPRYAIGWYELGRVEERLTHIPEARAAYAKSLASDSKYVNPYERLYLLSMQEKNWAEVAATTDRIMHLNPYDFPLAVYYNAVANLQLNKLDVAEKSARQAATQDPAGTNPKINYILGVIQGRKHDFKAAAESLRAYLKWDGITDRDRIVRMLANFERQDEARAEFNPEP